MEWDYGEVEKRGDDCRGKDFTEWGWLSGKDCPGGGGAESEFFVVREQGGGLVVAF